MMRGELEKDAPGYVDKLFAVWKDRVPREADLCCYWFEKVRGQIVNGIYHLPVSRPPPPHEPMHNSHAVGAN